VSGSRETNQVATGRWSTDLLHLAALAQAAEIDDEPASSDSAPASEPVALSQRIERGERLQTSIRGVPRGDEAVGDLIAYPCTGRRLALRSRCLVS
jgi:hypothetical protein